MQQAKHDMVWREARAGHRLVQDRRRLNRTLLGGGVFKFTFPPNDSDDSDDNNDDDNRWRITFNLYDLFAEGIGKPGWHKKIRKGVQPGDNVPVRYGDFKYHIKHGIAGLGLFAAEDIPAGAVLTRDAPFGKRLYIQVQQDLPAINNKKELSSFLRKHVAKPLRTTLLKRKHYLYATTDNVVPPRGAFIVVGLPQKSRKQKRWLIRSPTRRRANPSRKARSTKNMSEAIQYVLIEDPYDYPLAFSNSCVGNRRLCNVAVSGPEAEFKTTRTIGAGSEILWRYSF